MIEDFLPEGYKVGGVHEVRLPTYVNVSSKVTKALNLNIYRNLHHHHLNNQKQNFHKEVKPLLKGIPRADKIWLHYTIYAPRNGVLDIMNVGSIVDKYFSDTMVEAKKIMDDHFGHVVFISFSFGGVCPMDGHAIAKIHILETEEESKPMRVLLDENDIQTALNTYVEEQGIQGATGVELSVEDGEIVAEVTVGETKPKTTTRAPAKRGGRPRGSRNKPKTEEDTTSKEKVTDDNADDNSEDSSDGTTTGGSDTSEKETVVRKGKTEESSSDEGEAKNPSGEEENQSSESAKEAEDNSPEEDDVVTPKKKKRSIFDVD